MTRRDAFKAALAQVMEGKDMHAPMGTQMQGVRIRLGNTEILTTEGTVEHMRKQEEARAERAFSAITSPPKEDVVYERSMVQHQEEEDIRPLNLWTFVKGATFKYID